MELFEPTLSLYFSVVVTLLVIPFWFLRMLKGVLFYVYLWQLKEYRIERFVDHFRTEKGKKLILNKVAIAKGVLLVLGIPFLALPLYVLEALKFVYDLFRQRVRGPVATKKAKVLVLLNIGLLLMFSVFFFRGISEGAVSDTSAIRILLLGDLLLSIVISVVVLGLQPFTILVRNRRLASAKAKRAEFENLKVVGITGSYGKTSTKEFLAHILSVKFRVLKTPEHQNSEFGVANTILRSLTDEHEVFVCEMGAYKKGEIAALVEVAQPDIGIVTGVNEQHLATFGSMENLLHAEGGEELAEALPEGGAFIKNKNSKIKTQNDNVKCKTIVPEIPEAKVEKNRISFTIEGVSFHVPAYGGHNAQNLSLAIAAARELGMSLQEIAKAAETIPLELSAMKVRKGANGVTIIDSTYSANPDGVIADLDYLSLYEGRKVLVMPCLIELGRAAKEAHQRIGKKIAEVCDLAIITTREHFQDIKDGAGNSDKVLYIENTQEIVEKIKDANAILLESRLPEQLIKAMQND